MILNRLFETRAEKIVLGNPRDPVLRAWFGDSMVSAGVNVDENSALNYSAVWAATRLLSGSGSMLPLKLYRRIEGGGKVEARNHPVYRLIHDRPNSEMTSMMFRSSRMRFQVNHGNAYAEIERNGAGLPVALWPIHPTRVECRYDGAERLYYLVKNNVGSAIEFSPDDILHVPSIVSDDGICGKGVIANARESIGLGIATERHGSSFFGNGARPGIIVKHPKQLSDTARQNFRREWNEIHQGPSNHHKMALLSEGAEAMTLGFSPEDSQFLQTREHNVEEIARWYGVPPHLIGDLRRATFSNIEEQNIQFVSLSLMPWLVLWEQEINRKLLSEEDREEYFAEHVVDALLRGNSAARSQALQVQFQNGAINIDEWRSIENRNPLPDGFGKKHFVPLNMTTVENAGRLPEAEPVGEKPEPETEREEDNEPEERSTFNRESAIIAHRGVMVQIAGRLIRKEAQALRRAANKPERFLAWVDEFYAEHEPLFADELLPSLRAVQSTLAPNRTPEKEAERIARMRTEKARAELLEVAGVSPDSFGDAVERCAVSWEKDGASSLVDKELTLILGVST